jgi:RNA polymerase sigma-70 factor, ECF subfamily
MSGSRHEEWLRLFSDSHRALRRYVRRLVTSPAAADDIVQEAFLRTYEHGSRAKTPRAVLFSAARNLAVDARRHARVAKTDSLGDLDVSGVAPTSDSPEAVALADEESRLLREAVQRLTPHCRAVFALRVFHACSYKEIAERLGISVKTVEKHVAQGLRETHRYLRRQYRDGISDHE